MSAKKNLFKQQFDDVKKQDIKKDITDLKPYKNLFFNHICQLLFQLFNLKKELFNYFMLSFCDY